MARMRIQTTGITKRVTLDSLLPESDLKKLRAMMAREAIDSASAQNRRVFGADVPHKEFVDGREGAPLDSVNPHGRIDAEWQMMDEAVRWVLEELRRTSPVKDGDYRASHVVVIDGVASDGDMLPSLFDEVAIMSTVPYARKIERGLSNQAPDGVYEVLAAVAKRRFGNVARIKFSYRSPLFGGVDTWAASDSAARLAMKHKRKKGASDWLRRQPAIIISPIR